MHRYGEAVANPRRRSWLAWLPPLVLAAALIGVIQARSGPAPLLGDAAGPNETSPGGPPTTGFAQRVPSLPDQPFDYTVEVPGHLAPVAAAFESSPPENPVTDEGATLGRVLFYDVNLSRNRTVRCASCHVQAHSFTDPLVRSQGLDGFRTRRNSMSLANAAFNPSGRYLWDEGAETLEEQVLMPFEDRLEMDLDLDQVVSRVEAQDYYRPLFLDAFGDDEVTAQRVAAALAQFVRALVSADAPYDRARVEVDDPGVDFPAFSPAENRGKALFLTPRTEGGAGCADCHATEAQIGGVDGLTNNGIDPPSEVRLADDLGAAEITGDPALVGAFRVPSLRNVEVTGPYMHDGRFVSLTQVLEHYSRGVQAHENLSDPLRAADGQPFAEPFTDDEIADLLAFLGTLTDRSFLDDPRFAEPFRAGP